MHLPLKALGLENPNQGFPGPVLVIFAERLRFWVVLGFY